MPRKKRRSLIPHTCRARVRTRSWYDLAVLCARAHDQLYLRRDPESAAGTARKMEQTLVRLAPDEASEVAIAYWEARAFIAELAGEFREAVRCRRREIDLTEQLQELVRRAEAPKSVLLAGKRWGGSSKLEGRGADVLEARRSILRELLRREQGG